MNYKNPEMPSKIFLYLKLYIRVACWIFELLENNENYKEKKLSSTF